VNGPGASAPGRPPDQGFGAAARWRLADQFYVLAGLADANGDPGGIWNSVDAFFDPTDF
jgi:hypothetical protein